MTYQGAIDELKSLENNSLMPDWFKPTIKKIRETMEMDGRENVKGEWEEWKHGKYEGIPICSNCKHGFPFGFHQYNFCPNCGADMRGE